MPVAPSAETNPCEPVALKPVPLAKQHRAVAKFGYADTTLALLNQEVAGQLRACSYRAEQAYVLELPKPETAAGAVFVSGYSNPGNSFVFGLLDASDGSAEALAIVVSADEGRSFRQCSFIEKPRPNAELSFMSSQRAGQLSVWLEVSECPGCEGERGEYVYETTDGARSWSEPQHRPPSAR